MMSAAAAVKEESSSLMNAAADADADNWPTKVRYTLDHAMRMATLILKYLCIDDWEFNVVAGHWISRSPHCSPIRDLAEAAARFSWTKLQTDIAGYARKVVSDITKHRKTSEEEEEAIPVVILNCCFSLATKFVSLRTRCDWRYVNFEWVKKSDPTRKIQANEASVEFGWSLAESELMIYCVNIMKHTDIRKFEVRDHVHQQQALVRRQQKSAREAKVKQKKTTKPSSSSSSSSRKKKPSNKSATPLHAATAAVAVASTASTQLLTDFELMGPPPPSTPTNAGKDANYRRKKRGGGGPAKISLQGIASMFEAPTEEQILRGQTMDVCELARVEHHTPIPIPEVGTSRGIHARKAGTKAKARVAASPSSSAKSSVSTTTSRIRVKRDHDGKSQVQDKMIDANDVPPMAQQQQENQLPGNEEMQKSYLSLQEQNHLNSVFSITDLEVRSLTKPTHFGDTNDEMKMVLDRFNKFNFFEHKVKSVPGDDSLLDDESILNTSTFLPANFKRPKPVPRSPFVMSREKLIKRYQADNGKKNPNPNPNPNQKGEEKKRRGE